MFVDYTLYMEFVEKGVIEDKIGVEGVRCSYYDETAPTVEELWDKVPCQRKNE